MFAVIVKFLCVWLLSSGSFTGAVKLNPVILVPGDGGNQMEAKLDKPSVVHYVCSKKTDDYYGVWLSLTSMMPAALDCFIDNVRLVYNNVTRTTSNSPGVDIRIPGWGNTESTEYLDNYHLYGTSYFYYIAELLVSMGYERNVTLRGAPYDFRKAPNELGDYFDAFKELIESTYYAQGNTPVIILTHSLGSLMSLYLLNHQSQSWKNKFIHSMITLAGPWAGAVKAVRIYAVGDDLGFYDLSYIKMRDEQRTSPSLAFLLPNTRFWGPDEVLIATDKANYSTGNYEQYFKDLNFTDGWNMRKDTEKLLYDLTPPGVEVHCLYGAGVDTDEKVTFKPGTFGISWPTITYGPGDGTVNQRSLEACQQWKTQQKQPVYPQSFPAVSHLGILKDGDVLTYLKQLLTNKKRRKPRRFK